MFANTTTKHNTTALWWYGWYGADHLTLMCKDFSLLLSWVSPGNYFPLPNRLHLRDSCQVMGKGCSPGFLGETIVWNIYTPSQHCLLARSKPVNVQYVLRVGTTDTSVQFKGIWCLRNHVCGSCSWSPLTGLPWLWLSSAWHPLAPRGKTGWIVFVRCCWAILMWEMLLRLPPAIRLGSRRPGYIHGEVLVLKSLGCSVW